MKMSDTTAIVGDEPKTFWTKLLTSTPVVMTVVSTLLAGLSNSEMSRAQYDRSMAAQQQAQVGDQWGYFQAKKLRGATLKASLDVLEATADVTPVEEGPLCDAIGPTVQEDATGKATLGALVKGQLPTYKAQSIQDPAIQNALEAVGSEKPEADIEPLLRQISESSLVQATQVAGDNTRGYDRQMAPILARAEQWKTRIYQRPDATRSQARGLAAACMRLESLRYEQDSHYNSTVAQLKELQVRLSNQHAERHHLRSKWFFFGMLAAQLAVILATFALALKRRSLVWGLATSLGMCAVGFGVYVYGWV